MHPFSLAKENCKDVVGGVVAGGCVTWEFKEIGEVTLSMLEVGGPIQVTLAIPEDGYDPRPIDFM